MSADEVAKAFVNHFYQTFDASCDGLAGLYVSLSVVVDGKFGSSALVGPFGTSPTYTFHEDLSLVTCAGGGPSIIPFALKTMKVDSISM